MKAEIISVGTELLLGEITDTNSRFLASELPALGIDLYWVSQVGDNQTRLVKIIKRALQRSDLVLLTGGLGPTDDDITREAVAEVLGEKMTIVPEVERQLRAFFARMGREMSDTNLKQATTIPSARIIPNVNGTAPAWWVEKDGHILVAMPGPPGEMQPMWRDEVRPHLQTQSGGDIIVSRTIKTFSVPESTMSEQVASFLAASNPTTGIYAKADGIHLRLTAKAGSEEAAAAMISQNELKLMDVVGDYVWGFDDDTMEAVCGRLLEEHNLSLAVMEGYSGGLLTTTITGVPEMAAHFKGGLVAASDEARIACGVDFRLISDYGRESAEMARAMAEAVRQRLGASVGIGVTGVDDAGESEAKLFGTVHIAVTDGKNTYPLTTRYPGGRNRVRRWATSAALFSLKKLLSA